MEIRRDSYVQALKDRMHNGLIKVVTGIRRSGKSFLLFRLFRRELLAQGVPEDHIVGMELDLFNNSEYREPAALMEYVRARVKGDGEYYILLDEVQMLSRFEEVLNTFLHWPNVDVYVTGSNSKFLSKDIITEFRGRGDDVHVYPLSFAEFMQVYPGDMYHGWADYITWGGLPLVATMRTEKQKSQYLTSLFSEVYLKDIIERNKIKKTQALEDLINVLASSVGSLTSPSKIAATFQSALHSSLGVEAVRRYIELLEDAFIVCAAQRYDVKGRKYIGSPVKYYFEDLGLRNARLGFRQVEETHLMGNAIFNELRQRGYLVDVGVVDERVRTAEGKQERRRLEIDFVANLGSRRYYVQSAFSTADPEKRAQERRSLLHADDSFKKIILVKDVINPWRDENGIVTMSVYDFLMRPDSLEL